MPPEQISIFNDEKQTQVVDSYINRNLFSEHILRHDFLKSKEWRAAKSSEESKNVFATVNGHFQRTGSLRSSLEHLGWHFAGQRGYFLLFSNKPDGPIRLSALLDESMDTGAACRLILNMRDTGADWGILSDGSKWRLLRSGLFSAPNRFLEFGQTSLDSDCEKIFFLLFGAKASTSSTTFADRMFRLSRERAARTRDSLRCALRQTATVISRGFLAAESLTTGAAPTPEALDMVYKHSLIVIQRLVYILFAESTGVLPGDGESYSSTIGLRGLAARKDSLNLLMKNKSALSFKLWESVDNLLTAIRHGDASLQVPCLAGELTDTEAHPFLNINRVPDAFMAEAIELLSLIEGENDKPGDAYKEMDASDIISACETFSELKLQIAEKPMALVSENGSLAWVDRSKAKWKKALETVSKGDTYLDCISENSSAWLPFEIWVDFSDAAFRSVSIQSDARIFIPQSGSGSLYAASLDAFSISVAASTDSVNANPYSFFLRQCARRTIALDTNPISVEFTKLAAFLSTLDEEPAEVLSHNIRLGSALCGARPVDISSYPGNLDVSEEVLGQWAKDIEESLNRQRPGLAGYKARENGLRKGDRRSDRAATSDLWRAAGWKNDFDDAFSVSQKEPPLVGKAFRVLHPAVHFPEVFYARLGKKPACFALILCSSSNSAEREEVSFLRASNNMKGNFSVIEASYGRFFPLVAAGSSYAILDSASFFSTSDGKTFLAALESSPEIIAVDRKKIKERKTVALIKKK